MIIITKRKMSTGDGDGRGHGGDGVAGPGWQNTAWRNKPFVLGRNVRTPLNMHVNLSQISHHSSKRKAKESGHKYFISLAMSSSAANCHILLGERLPLAAGWGSFPCAHPQQGFPSAKINFSLYLAKGFFFFVCVCGGGGKNSLAKEA